MNCDCHIHTILDGQDWKAAIARHREKADEQYLRNLLLNYQKLGYTYLRDGGDRWGVCELAKSLAPEYNISFSSPGAPLYMKGCYGGFIGTGFSDLREYRQLAREKKGDFLKIMVSGIMDFSEFGKLSQPQFQSTYIEEMISVGKDRGMKVMAHANGADTVIAAAEAGVDSIEHGAYINEEALAAMAEHRVIWVPTLSPVGDMIGKGRFDDGVLKKIMVSFQKNLRMFHDMGGLIACGSDAGAWAVPHGCGSEEKWMESVFGDETENILNQGNAALCQRFQPLSK